jgi:DNA-binding GntR family transcriptional regulator
MANELQTVTLGDGVYELLRSDIVLGKIQPNTFLQEAELADRLGVSRTPIREALLRLAKDQLVVSHRRRWLVTELSITEIREIYQVRAALEGFAAHQAALNADPEQIAAITQALEAREHAGPDPSAIVTSNELFHRLIVEASGNQRLVWANKNNMHFYFNVQVAGSYTAEDLGVSNKEHRALVDAIVDRDPDRAEQINRAHILHSLEMIEARRALGDDSGAGARTT